ncbi:hypothetical protein C5E07_11325 [Pseudoclavibacter sp. RFBJ3]|nr:hypothetical protein C5C12_10400 [Pseudoclavibacter sp. RFBJ5]PPF91852.1 hypothetical protein C5E07_11325 [Pseudoclavibacter sp. RFBJ3]PPG01153.1 hypothetical protein C5C19_00630 [Pseudoclavibacter sp. RFBH5]PPG26252.1 hypothetical protein C5E13_00585 [Pseudoclavibacter sp. RFBI4]
MGGGRTSWAKAGGPPRISVCLETAATNGLFRGAFAGSRCIVPMSGYYEWEVAEPTCRSTTSSTQAPRCGFLLRSAIRPTSAFRTSRAKTAPRPVPQRCSTACERCTATRFRAPSPSASSMSFRRGSR